MFLRQIRYFVAVVSSGSFTEAAEQCYISQSAISQQIRVLEDELGIQLLTRGNRRFVVTPAGEYFYERSRQILDAVSDMQQETLRIAHGNHATLSIGYLSVYSGAEFGLAVAEFAGRHPDVDLQVHSGTHEELYEMLLSGKADLVMSDPRRAFSDDYVNQPIFTGYCYAECPGHGSLSQTESVTIEELGKLPCILVSSQAQRKTEKEYYQRYIGLPGPFLFAENLEEARMLVVGGKGFLPLLETTNHLPQMGARVRRLPLMKNGQQIRRSYYTFWLKKHDDPLLREFSDILKSLFEHA